MKLYGQTLKEWYQDIVADDPEMREVFFATLVYCICLPLAYRSARRTVRKRGGGELFAFAWAAYTVRSMTQMYHLQRLAIEIKYLRRELKEQLRPGTATPRDMQALMNTTITSLGCTGRFDDRGRLLHDGETCPIHEP